MNRTVILMRCAQLSPASRKAAKPVRLGRTAAGWLRHAGAMVALAVLAACSAGGPSTSVNQPTSSTSTANSYTGPAAANADVQAFKVNLWENIRVSSKCGGCHHEGGQAPMFARSDDVNLAYQAAGPLVSFTQPDQSELVLKVSGGHNCWVSDPKACGDTMLTWIKAWVGAGSSSTTGIQLQAPPSQSVGGGKQFPVNATDTGTTGASFAATIWQPILSQFCSNCHRATAQTPQQPYFAPTQAEVAANANLLQDAFVAAQSKIDLNSPDQSRFVVRLRDESHNCWVIPPGTVPDCAGSAAKMLAAIQAYAGGIAVTQVDQNLVLSKALSLKQGTIASGGNRFEGNLVAKYEFKTGTGTTAYDTSGVSPEADLTLSGAVTWAGGWGINVAAGGKAQASTAASSKIADMIKSSGEFSIEAWAAPANVAQNDAYIVSYSGSATTRNATLGQHSMQYEGYVRSDKTNTNGSPPLQTAAANMNAQAALQHIVLTFDPVNGRKLYVNGKFTGDVDKTTGGSLANWDDTFALVLGNETTGNRQFLGLIKFVAIHSRALTADQVAQNFAAGVGERYFVLFDVSGLSGVPQSYIMFTGSVYDSYAYLFTNPTFVSLDPNAVPASIPIKGMRIGVNGVLSLPGQSYSTINTTLGGSTYSAQNGQLLSSVGAVVASDKGVDTDLFFLSFDQFGSKSHVFTDPSAVVVTPTTTTNPTSADLGVKTFGEINATMSVITGVSMTNAAVNTAYMSLQQSLPPASDLSAFVASQQTAIAQLAVAYCTALVDTAASRDALFGTGLDASINATASSFFGVSPNYATNRTDTTGVNTAHRGIVITALVNAAGSTANPNTAAAITTELNGLMNDLPSITGQGSITVSAVTKASCEAVLGSAATTLK
ncbi:MAG TPA: LamG domain-containing protein [Steroidobacteraceae bacterium]